MLYNAVHCCVTAFPVAAKVKYQNINNIQDDYLFLLIPQHFDRPNFEADLPI